MKYVALLTRGEWEDAAAEAEKAQIYGAIQDWWGQRAAEGKIVGGLQLKGPETATTVVVNGNHSQILDGPYMEAKEAIGGYGVLEVADLDEAIAIARTFPSPSTKLELRPVLERN